MKLRKMKVDLELIVRIFNSKLYHYKCTLMIILKMLCFEPRPLSLRGFMGKDILLGSKHSIFYRNLIGLLFVL